MDGFAQSKADDDLFDDDLIPVETTEEQDDVHHIAKDVQLMSLERQSSSPSVHAYHARDYGLREQTGRGPGGEDGSAGQFRPRRQNNPVLKSRHPPEPTSSCDPPTAAEPTTIALDASRLVPEVTEGSSAPQASNASQIPSTAACAPSDHSSAAKPPAVRGDRTATGGVKKPKLTEQELTAKLAAAKARSENLSAAHARAEADAASFQEQERAAVEKQTWDAAHRKVMEGEREKNRARKMAVRGGREWDSQKNEKDHRVDSRGGGKDFHIRGNDARNRTINNERVDEDLAQYQWKGDRARIRGRSGRAQGRGRGGLRRGGIHQEDVFDQAGMSADTDFPSLPMASNEKDRLPSSTEPVLGHDLRGTLSPIVGAGSWADQMETSEAARPHSDS